MKLSPPLAAIAIPMGLTALIISGLSCSSQPTTFKLRVKYDPVGTTAEYKMDSHRVGMVYKNDEMVEEFDVKVEGDILYTTQKVLPDGDCIVLEENVWSWDEPVDDSGQVKRITKDYAYKYRISPLGKMTDMKMLGKPSKQWEDYVISFVEQGMPIFPEEAISAGYKWSQTAMVELPDQNTFEAITDYTIKGTAQKNGYNCAIIEYKGNLAIPLFPEADDTLSAFGVDHIELNGILFFAIDAGFGINSEERRRVISERSFPDKKTGEIIHRRHEFEATISSNLISLGPG
jgi:hypothetical protein